MPWVDWPLEGLFDWVLDGLSVLLPDCVPLMLPPLFSPLFSCVADGDLLESPICDWAAATPPNPTTAATATVANSFFFISLSSVLPQSQADAFRIREMPVPSHVLPGPTRLRQSRSGKFHEE